MARSAADLAAALRVVGEQDGYDRWREMVAAGAAAETLKDFRIGVPPDDRICPVSSDVRAVLDAAMAALRKAGAKIEARLAAGRESGRVDRDVPDIAGRQHVLAAARGAARTDASRMGAQPARSDAQRRVRAA
jgi:Asp-tRNA(Asn)/Glu-tRNA(Gln) amidotransferase A subunit family amidase